MEYKLKKKDKLLDLGYTKQTNDNKHYWYELNHNDFTFKIIIKVFKNNVCKIYAKTKHHKAQELEDLMSIAEILYEETLHLKKENIIDD